MPFSTLPSTPDICFAIHKFSQYVQSPTSLHWNACKILLRYLKGILDHGLQIRSSMKLVIHGLSNFD